MLAVGNRVGDYQIVDRLRAGGMATLYLARRTGASGFSKTVAIKVIHPHLATDEAFVRMFVDEALLSARIQHPNVVHVEELREADGQHLLVMEYVPGCSLSQLLRVLYEQKRRLTIELAVLIAIRIAEGLHAAHETRGSDGKLLGVVHRDVSPQNVLLAYQGHVKLIDFGIARARGRGVETSSTSLKGKVRYMAPEQAFGRAVDRRADVYSLALVLWEMLAMRQAFEGDNDLALLERVRNPGPPTPPSRFAPDVPKDLDRAVLAAMEPDLETRTPTALAFRRALGDAFPRALALDDSYLADLLTALLPQQMAEERERAADSASGVRGARGGPVAPDEVIGTMTLAHAELLDAKTEISDSSGVSAPPSGARPIAPGPSSGATPLAGPPLVPVPSPSSGATPLGSGATPLGSGATSLGGATPLGSGATPLGSGAFVTTPVPTTGAVLDVELDARAMSRGFSRTTLIAFGAIALVGFGAGVAWAAMRWSRDDPQPVFRTIELPAPAAPAVAPAATVATPDAAVIAPAPEPPPVTQPVRIASPRRPNVPRARPTSRVRTQDNPTKTRRPGVPLADRFGD